MCNFMKINPNIFIAPHNISRHRTIVLAKRNVLQWCVTIFRIEVGDVPAPARYTISNRAELTSSLKCCENKTPSGFKLWKTFIWVTWQRRKIKFIHNNKMRQVFNCHISTRSWKNRKTNLMRDGECQFWNVHAVR